MTKLIENLPEYEVEDEEERSQINEENKSVKSWTNSKWRSSNRDNSGTGREAASIKLQSRKSKETSVDSGNGGRSNSSKDWVMRQSAQSLSKTSNMSAPRGG
jgi:hypothetical protein